MRDNPKQQSQQQTKQFYRRETTFASDPNAFQSQSSMNEQFEEIKLTEQDESIMSAAGQSKVWLYGSNNEQNKEEAPAGLKITLQQTKVESGKRTGFAFKRQNCLRLSTIHDEDESSKSAQDEDWQPPQRLRSSTATDHENAQLNYQTHQAYELGYLKSSSLDITEVQQKVSRQQNIYKQLKGGTQESFQNLVFEDIKQEDIQSLEHQSSQINYKWALMQEDVEVAPVSLKNSRFENMFESLMGSGQKQVLMRFPSIEEQQLDIDSDSQSEISNMGQLQDEIKRRQGTAREIQNEDNMRSQNQKEFSEKFQRNQNLSCSKNSKIKSPFLKNEQLKPKQDISETIREGTQPNGQMQDTERTDKYGLTTQQNALLNKMSSIQTTEKRVNSFAAEKTASLKQEGNEVNHQMNYIKKKDQQMLESFRFIKKLGTMNHSKRQKNKEKKRATGVGGNRIANTENYGSPQSTYILQNGNRLGIGSRNQVNVESFNINTLSNLDEVQTKMGMEPLSGHLKSYPSESEDFEYDYEEDDASVSSKSQSGIYNLRNQQKPDNRQLQYQDIDYDPVQNEMSEETQNIIEKVLVENPHSNLEEMKHQSSRCNHQEENRSIQHRQFISNIPQVQTKEIIKKGSIAQSQTQGGGGRQQMKILIAPLDGTRQSECHFEEIILQHRSQSPDPQYQQENNNIQQGEQKSETQNETIHKFEIHDTSVDIDKSSRKLINDEELVKEDQIVIDIPNKEHNKIKQHKKKSGSSRGSNSFETLRSLDKSSLFLFPQTSNIRILFSKILISKITKYFLLIAVLLNCLALSFQDYTRHPDLNHEKLISQINFGFTVVYTCEMTLRIIVQGLFVHEKAYLRNIWHINDLLVVIAGYLEMILSSEKQHALRLIRVICRPLKLVNQVKSIKTLIKSLVASLPEFANIGIFMIFIFVLFATMGLQQYNGWLQNSCRYTEFPKADAKQWESDLQFKRPCTQTGLGNFQCPTNMFCENLDQYLKIDVKTEKIDDRGYINYGITNFDNLGGAFLTVFQMITSETWYPMLMNTMDIDIPIISAFYCFGIIIVGQFFLLNLILAVIIQAFIKQKEQMLEQELLNEQQMLQEEENEYVSEKEEQIDEDEENKEERPKKQSYLMRTITKRYNKQQSKKDLEEVEENQGIDKLDDLDQEYENKLFNRKGRRTTQHHILEEELEGDHRKKKGRKEMKRSITSNHLHKREMTKQLSRMDLPDAKQLQEEERKYNENEDFTVFLKPQAQKRKIARLLMNIKDPKNFQKQDSTQQEEIQNADDNERQAPEENKFKSWSKVRKAVRKLIMLQKITQLPKRKREAEQKSSKKMVPRPRPRFKNSDNGFLKQVKFSKPLQTKKEPRKRESLPANIFFHKKKNYEESRRNIGSSYPGQDSMISFAMLDRINLQSRILKKIAEKEESDQILSQQLQKYQISSSVSSQEQYYEIIKPIPNQRIEEETDMPPINKHNISYAQSYVTDGISFNPRNKNILGYINNQSFGQLNMSKLRNHISLHPILKNSRLIQKDSSKVETIGSIIKSIPGLPLSSGLTSPEFNKSGIINHNQQTQSFGQLKRRTNNTNSPSQRDMMPIEESKNEVQLSLPHNNNENSGQDKKVMQEKTINELMNDKINFQIIQAINQSQLIQNQFKEKIKERSKNNLLVKVSVNITESQVFKAIMILSILVNIASLMIDQHPLNLVTTKQIEGLNIYFGCIYTFEMCLKILAFGFRDFLKHHPLNVFDSIIVVFTLVDIFLVHLFLLKQDFAIMDSSIIITLLKTARIMRIFKLARYWRSFNILLNTLWLTLVNISSFAQLLSLVLFIYTMVGLELFSNKAAFNSSNQVVTIEEGGTPPMFNFDGFMNSLFTVYVVLTNDGQSTIYYNYYRAVGSSKATLFWISFVVLAQKILLNVFLAILLEKFDEVNKKEQILQENEKLIEEQSDGKIKNSSQFVVENLQKMAVRIWSRFLQLISSSEDEVKKKQSLTASIPKKDANFIEDQFKIHQVYGRSLGFLPENMKFRLFIAKILQSRATEIIMIVVILLSLLQLAMDSPVLDPDSKTKSALVVIDKLTMAVFTVEIVSKIVAYGFLFNGEYSYMRELWNIMDFFILAVSYVCLLPSAQSLRVIKTFRILRCLRLIGRNEGLKIAVRALLFAIPNIISITVIMIMFFLVFAVISVSYFKGKMFYCQYALAEIQVLDKWQCLAAGGLWINRILNFDNISNALVTLFIMSTTAGWSENMMFTIQGTEIDMVPDSNQRNPAWMIFYMVFMIVGCFFFLNLFVAVVINTFKREEGIAGGSNLLTDKQKEWIDLRLLILRASPLKKPKEPQNDFRALIYKIESHRYFEQFVQMCILLNTFILMLKWYRQTTVVENSLEVLNILFTIMFCLEAVIRITAIGFQNYFKDNWNIFDFIIALGSLIGIIVNQLTAVQIKGMTIIRAFRILRIARLLKRGGKSLNLIFNTFIITMQQLANIGGLLLLFMYIYAIIGMIYFGQIKRNDSMNDYINFESFTSAFITLFTVATGDSWNYTTQSFTHDLTPNNNCIENPTYSDYANNGKQMIGCSTRTSALIFFISYMFIVSLIFLKLFIAIILGGYDQTQLQDSRLFNHEMTMRFKEVWAEFDPDATTYIKLSQIRDFLFALGAPLGFDESYKESKYLQDRFIASLDLPIYENFTRYQFLDVLDALSFRLMILDHIQKIYEEQQHQAISHQDNDPQKHLDVSVMMDPQKFNERNMKATIEKEVNKLIYQKQSENIVAFKELWEKEQRKKQNTEKWKDQSGFTSQHHMAIEAGVRRIKANMAKKKQQALEKAKQQQQTARKTMDDDTYRKMLSQRQPGSPEQDVPFSPMIGTGQEQDSKGKLSGVIGKLRNSRIFTSLASKFKRNE